ncbi:MAG: galactokinase [Balneolaceae bacterium]|nr:MAG: galactokinase [Balneolaceae bacterium]
MKKNQIIQSFKEIFGGEFRLFSAPGRINIIGEHTDYNEGFVMPAAIDKKIWLAIHPVHGRKASIYSVDYDETSAFDLDGDMSELPHWALYPYGVVKELQKKGCNPGGFKAVFGGDIPDGAGLSSSAAIECVFGTALNSLFDFGLDKLTIAKVGQLAEHNYAGVRCGLMDQFASMHGKAGHVIRLDCRSLDYEYAPLELSGHELILTDTRVKHSLASTEYNHRRAACEEGVRIIASNMPSINSLRDLRPKNVLPYKDILGEETFLCCEFVTEENERVLETVKALESNDLEKVGHLINASHRGLRDKYRVSCPELDLLVETANTVDGVLGSRMMGGGFGGCTITLLKTSSTDKYIKVTQAAFHESFGSEPVYYKVSISNGAGEEMTG